MVHFKVVKLSHLLLGTVIVVLAVVIGVIAFDFFSGREAKISAQASLVQNMKICSSEAETDVVFASLAAQERILQLDPDEDAIDIEIIAQTSETNSKPSVLIYHTHTHEAYEQIAEDRYIAIEAWRTYDHDYSVVRVGEELARLLRDRGFEVIHDTTDNEQDQLSTAYTRSLEMLEGYDRQFDLYIDLHRDAYIEGVNYAQVKDDGKSLAQLMLLIGNGEGFEEKPYFKENLLFAQHLTKRINAEKEDLCKDVLIKDGRYNQHIGVFSILLEVGHNRNILQEALNALPYLSDALYSLMIEKPVQELADAQKAFVKLNQSSNDIIS